MTIFTKTPRIYLFHYLKISIMTRSNHIVCNANTVESFAVTVVFKASSHCVVCRSRCTVRIRNWTEACLDLGADERRVAIDSTELQTIMKMVLLFFRADNSGRCWWTTNRINFKCNFSKYMILALKYGNRFSETHYWLNMRHSAHIKTYLKKLSLECLVLPVLRRPIFHFRHQMYCIADFSSVHGARASSLIQ